MGFSRSSVWTAHSHLFRAAMGRGPVRLILSVNGSDCRSWISGTIDIDMEYTSFPILLELVEEKPVSRRYTFRSFTVQTCSLRGIQWRRERFLGSLRTHGSLHRRLGVEASAIKDDSGRSPLGDSIVWSWDFRTRFVTIFFQLEQIDPI